MDTLILTGWGWTDYACAAALALRHLKFADILGMSTRRLPEFLNEVSGCKVIVVLGVGLSGDPELLEHAVGKLTKKGTKIIWLSALPFPETLPGGVRTKIESFVADDGLVDAVGQYYDIRYDDLLPIMRKEDTPYLQLLEAAMYTYRNYQDEKAYANAIRHIAAGDAPSKWSDSERGMIEHYKRYGNRELVGCSIVTQELLHRINQVAAHDRARVLILGESGTGKETVASQIHNKSPRRNEP